MRFIDEAIVTVSAGKGGDGLASFRRAPFEPKGGPDGGDGGRGGDVIFKATAQISTLADFTSRRHIRAQNGAAGQGSRKHGRKGENVVVEVPVGTVVYETSAGSILADLIDEGQSVVIVNGGRGGRGNVHFATPTNRSPRKAETGKPGESLHLRLDLKLLADVGLVGRPNAGKSTLLAALSAARPKIGDFPFTTLEPGLGVVAYGAYQRFVVADIPGLAEGAAQGRGLGHQFLRHIERTRLIVMMIETPDPDYKATYQGLLKEMNDFSPNLPTLPRLNVRSKADLPMLESSGKCVDFPFDLTISAVTGQGLPELIEIMGARLGLIPESVLFKG